MVSKAAQKANGVQTFVVGQLEEARKQIARFEKELVTRSRQQRKELEGLLHRLQEGAPDLKGIRTRAEDTTAEVKKALDGLQHRVVEAVGVASQAQVGEIKRELSKLSKKLDALVAAKKASATPN